MGKQFLPDLIKVLSILSQSLDKLFLNEYKEKKAMIQKGCLKTIKEDNNIHFVFKRRSGLYITVFITLAESVRLGLGG